MSVRRLFGRTSLQADYSTNKFDLTLWQQCTVQFWSNEMINSCSAWDICRVYLMRLSSRGWPCWEIVEVQQNSSWPTAGGHKFKCPNCPASGWAALANGGPVAGSEMNQNWPQTQHRSIHVFLKKKNCASYINFLAYKTADELTWLNGDELYFNTLTSSLWL